MCESMCINGFKLEFVPAIGAQAVQQVSNQPREIPAVGKKFDEFPTGSKVYYRSGTDSCSIEARLVCEVDRKKVLVMTTEGTQVHPTGCLYVHENDTYLDPKGTRRAKMVPNPEYRVPQVVEAPKVYFRGLSIGTVFTCVRSRNTFIKSTPDGCTMIRASDGSLDFLYSSDTSWGILDNTEPLTVIGNLVSSKPTC